jgi:nucleotide-binding universal stress UspA family protein
LPDVIGSTDGTVPEQVERIALSAAALREKAEALARAFERHCEAAGVASFESRVVVDEAVDAVVRHGRCSDLVVVGQRDRDAPVEGVAFDFPQQVLLHAGVPVLVVPHAGSGPTLGQRVVVAWKDRPEAARAVRDALPLLRTAERVVLCAVAEGSAQAPADDGADTVVPWLATHGIRVETHLEAPGDVGDRILTRAADCNADLIVSGGYGHSRLREWVLGGATRALLEHMTVPVLFSH